MLAQSRSPDAIICPFLATGVAQGQLVPDAKGEVAFSQIVAFLTMVGAPAMALLFGAPPLVAPVVNPLKIFDMDDNLALEHGVSSGIRDPAKNRTAMDLLLSYAGKDGVFTEAEFSKAGKYFDTHPGPETHVKPADKTSGA